LQSNALRHINKWLQYNASRHSSYQQANASKNINNNNQTDQSIRMINSSTGDLNTT
jgi:hypothetical protein